MKTENNFSFKRLYKLIASPYSINNQIRFIIAFLLINIGFIITHAVFYNCIEFPKPWDDLHYTPVYYYRNVQLAMYDIALLIICVCILLFNVLYTIKFTTTQYNDNKTELYISIFINSFIILPIIEIFHLVYLSILFWVLIIKGTDGVLTVFLAKLIYVIILIFEVIILFRMDHISNIYHYM